VGNCPLLRLEYASRLTGCNVLAKAEYANPGGSIKDRAALYVRRSLPHRRYVLLAWFTGAEAHSVLQVDDQGRRKARRARAGRAGHRRRGHRGQHGHWPRAGRGIDGLRLDYLHGRGAFFRLRARSAPGADDDDDDGRPQTQSEEKKQTLRLAGAHLVLVPAVCVARFRPTPKAAVARGSARFHRTKD